MIFSAFLLGAQHERDSVENKPASSLAVSLGKTLLGQDTLRDPSIFIWQTGGVPARTSPGYSCEVALKGTPPLLCGRQVAQTTWNWELPSKCGRPVQNMAIQFAFS